MTSLTLNNNLLSGNVTGVNLELMNSTQMLGILSGNPFLCPLPSWSIPQPFAAQCSTCHSSNGLYLPRTVAPTLHPSLNRCDLWFGTLWCSQLELEDRDSTECTIRWRYRDFVGRQQLHTVDPIDCRAQRSVRLHVVTPTGERLVSARVLRDCRHLDDANQLHGSCVPADQLCQRRTEQLWRHSRQQQHHHLAAAFAVLLLHGAERLFVESQQCAAARHLIHHHLWRQLCAARLGTQVYDRQSDHASNLLQHIGHLVSGAGRSAWQAGGDLGLERAPHEPHECHVRVLGCVGAPLSYHRVASEQHTN